MNFIVVQANVDYDYVESVSYVASFPTYVAADIFIQEKKAEQNRDRLARFEYIEKWVDAIEIPETDYEGWMKFLDQWDNFMRNKNPQNFKKELKAFLRTSNHRFNNHYFNQYDPPSADFRCNNLFIVEITK